MTDAEKVQLQREAYVQDWRARASIDPRRQSFVCEEANAREAAALLYLLPRVPRVVRLGEYDFRVRDGRIECKAQGEGCYWGGYGLGAGRDLDVKIVTALSALIANPYEPEAP